MNSTIGQEFLEQTKYENMSPTAQKRGVEPPPLEQPGVSTERIPLPEPLLNSYDLGTAIAQRQTYRKYAETPLSMEELSALLWSTQGVRRVVGDQATFRTVPSAGARHAFETILLINRCGDLKPGLYHYHAIAHEISLISLSNTITSDVREACLNQKSIEQSAVTFIWVAVAERMVWRYGERGYRYMFLDAGHVCQNLYLAAETMDCGVCAVAAFNDDMMNEVLRLDGKHEFVIYIAPVGKKPAD